MSILSREAKYTATQCSAALPTIATMISDDEERRQADPLRRRLDRADEDLRHHADRDARARQHQHAALDAPRVLGRLVLAVGVEHVLVGLEREPQPGEVREQQHDGDRGRHVRDVGRVARRLLAQRRQLVAARQQEHRRQHERDHREQQHRGLRARRLGHELVPLAPPAADQERRAHHQQQVAEDGPDDRRLHHLVQALVEREQGDDQLRRVAERDVQQPADARARPGAPAPRSRGPSAPRSARRRARTRRTR